MENSKIVKALEFALELIRTQQVEIDYLKNAVFALRESTAERVPNLAFDEHLRQTVIDRHRMQHDNGEMLQRLSEAIQELRQSR